MIARRDDDTRPALVLAAHGSETDPRCAAPVHRAVETLRAHDRFADVHAVFWKQTPFFRDIGEVCDAREILVLPVMTADGYYARAVLPREIRAAHRSAESTITILEPIGLLPAVAGLLEVQASHALATEGVPNTLAHVVLVGHGTERAPEVSGATTYAHRDTLARRESFLAVHVAFLEQPPRIRMMVDALPARATVVLTPFLIANGGHAVDDIPAALGIAPGTRRHVDDQCRTLLFADAFGEHPDLADLLIRAAEEQDADQAMPVVIEP